MTWPAREDIRYTPLFCEENIWWLAGALVERGFAPERLTVLLFSNPWGSIQMSAQRAGYQGGQLVWDYHVVLRAEHEGADWVLDPDSLLAFPTLCEMYLQRSFPIQSGMPEQVRTWVRCIPAAGYLRHFHSDRRHMLGQIPDSAFPNYPIITPALGVPHITLAEYCDVHKHLADGSRVLPLDRLRAVPVRPGPDHASG